MQPTCPRCERPLTGGKHTTGISWRCKNCRGESLNFSQFRRLIPELMANEIWFTAMENPAAPRRATRCPECLKDMAAVLIPFQGREIELAICRTCQRLWLDNQENMPHTLDTGQPGKKPPVIRMMGRGVQRTFLSRLKPRRRREGSEYLRRVEEDGATRSFRDMILHALNCLFRVIRLLISRF